MYHHEFGITLHGDIVRFKKVKQKNQKEEALIWPENTLWKELSGLEEGYTHGQTPMGFGADVESILSLLHEV